MRVFSAVPLLTCAFLHICAGIALPKIPTPATSALILREPVHSEHESYFSTSPSIMSPSNNPTSASLRKKDQEVLNDESHRRPHEAWPTLAEDTPQTPSRRSNDEGGNPPFERDSPIPGPTERGLTSPTAWKLEKNSEDGAKMEKENGDGLGNFEILGIACGVSVPILIGGYFLHRKWRVR